MKFKAKKRVILSDFEPFLTLKFAKKMFSRAILPYRAVANCDFILLPHPFLHFGVQETNFKNFTTHQTVNKCMFIKIYIIPMPPRIPVINRRKLLLSILKINCIKPSAAIGTASSGMNK